MFPVFLLLMGCGGSRSSQALRLQEMADHEAALHEATAAIQAGDLDGLRAAGRALSFRDPVPGLPSHAYPHLVRMRTEAKQLANTPSLSDGAEQLTELTAYCAACHRALGASLDPSAPQPAHRQIWNALAFQDSGAWDVATTEAPDLRHATTWEDRRRAVTYTLIREEGTRN
ncbi:MAG: hypothetical protein AAGA48_07555 [Myxococcota bacterium]